jgi:hypothetical protein
MVATFLESLFCATGVQFRPCGKNGIVLAGHPYRRPLVGATEALAVDEKALLAANEIDDHFPDGYIRDLREGGAETAVDAIDAANCSYVDLAS